jgi:hypothetical protein
MELIRLYGDRFLNLDRVNLIECSAVDEVCCITWATGDAPLYLKGSVAVLFIEMLHGLTVDDIGAFPVLREAEALSVGNEHDIDE